MQFGVQLQPKTVQASQSPSIHRFIHSNNYVRHGRSKVLYLGKKHMVLYNVHYSAAVVGEASRRAGVQAKKWRVGHRVKTHCLCNTGKVIIHWILSVKKKLLKELNLLYMENKHEDTVVLIISSIFYVSTNGNAKPYD